MKAKSNRLDSVRVIVNGIISEMDSRHDALIAAQHLYGVADLAALLAKKRGLETELAAISGLLHDLYGYHTGISTFHGNSGAEMIRPILRDCGLFSADEQRLLISAVFHHSDKNLVHGLYDEVLKDADALQHYLSNTLNPVEPFEAGRIKTVLTALAIPASIPVAPDKPAPSSRPGRIACMSDLAEELAAKEIEGVPGNKLFRRICRYWPDENIYTALKGGWCAAFVYYCCFMAGLRLPIRHPLVSCRFAGVKAWQEWAQLDGVGFYHPANKTGFSARRGDIVIFDDLLGLGSHDHIGIVLGAGENEITTAEGNAGNQNRSAIVRHSLQPVAGYIRIDDSYNYSWTKDPGWKI